MAAPSPHSRRTKIVATLGPASDAPAMVAVLLAAGVDVVRINASHGDHKTHAAAIAAVRAAARRAARHVGILLDLQGPKIRVGAFAGPPRQVAAGEELVFAVGRPPAANELPADYPFLDRDVRVGQPLLINDGSLACEVTAVTPGEVRARARHAGEVAPRKGINLPHSDVSAPAISDKDRDDALFGVAQQVDMVAMSFVRRAEDVVALQALLAAAGRPIPVVAKIEKPQALDNLDAILAASWGVMVARGDLGVELSTSEVPMAQKRIICAANAQCKPVITATQMLESMTRSPQPTRAEASDVANAVLDGTDAVMLSAETATGAYPEATVRTMVAIIEATERHHVRAPQTRRRRRPVASIPEAVAHAGCDLADALSCRAIAVFTETGRMALLAAQRRPDVAILAFAATPTVRDRLALVWGVQPREMADVDTLTQRLQRLDQLLLAEHAAAPGDAVVVLVGAPHAPTGSTNLAMVHRIGAPEGS